MEINESFYPVRWATQKGDIFGVRAPKVAQLGGTDFFYRCVRGPARVAQLKIRGGDTNLPVLNRRSTYKNSFLPWNGIMVKAVTVFSTIIGFVEQEWENY